MLDRNKTFLESLNFSALGFSKFLKTKISGAPKLVNLEVTSPEAGIIKLTSNSSGGIKSVITNAGKANAGDTSKVILSDIDEEKTNEVTIAGIADNAEVSGGAGNDIINFGNSNKIFTKPKNDYTR